MTPRHNYKYVVLFSFFWNIAFPPSRIRNIRNSRHQDILHLWYWEFFWVSFIWQLCSKGGSPSTSSFQDLRQTSNTQITINSFSNIHLIEQSLPRSSQLCVVVKWPPGDVAAEPVAWSTFSQGQEANGNCLIMHLRTGHQKSEWRFPLTAMTATSRDKRFERPVRWDEGLHDIWVCFLGISVRHALVSALLYCKTRRTSFFNASIDRWLTLFCEIETSSSPCSWLLHNGCIKPR